MKAEHTKGKLERNFIKGWELWIGADYHIADVHGQLETRRANALHIVQCWNNHEALLAALKDVSSELTLLEEIAISDGRFDVATAAAITIKRHRAIIAKCEEPGT